MSLNKLHEICGSWGVEFESSPGPGLVALQKMLSDSKETQLRAAQFVVAGGDGERVKQLESAKYLRKISDVAPHAWEPLLLRAMVLAAWPARCGGIAETLGAPWEAPERQDRRFMGAVQGWWESLVVVEQRVEMGEGVTVPVLEGVENNKGNEERVEKQPPQSLMLESADVLISLTHLSQTETGWNFNDYSNQLIVVFRAMQDDCRLLGGEGNQLQNATSAVNLLETEKRGSRNYSQISSNIINFFNYISNSLPGLGGIPIFHTDFLHLQKNQNQGWSYNGNWAPHFFRLLLYFRDRVIDIHQKTSLQYLINESQQKINEAIKTLRDDQDVQTTNLQTWANTLNTSLTQHITALDQRVATARPPEVNLLWWGEARYSTTYKKPFRKLSQQEQLWAAASEAADHCQKLPAAPSAAYLVRVLQELGQDINEKATVLHWAQQAYRHLRANRTEENSKLLPLAKLDATGLPISKIRLLAQVGDEPDTDSLREIFIDPNQEIDLGDWVSWIFYEQLLERRLS